MIAQNRTSATVFVTEAQSFDNTPIIVISTKMRERFVSILSYLADSSAQVSQHYFTLCLHVRHFSPEPAIKNRQMHFCSKFIYGLPDKNLKAFGWKLTD